MASKKRDYFESAILGAAGLIAFTIVGMIVYVIGLAFGYIPVTKPFMDEIFIILDFPIFFLAVAIVKIMIGGNLIELTVKAISRILRLKKKLDPSKAF